jgi:type IV secretion system protein VirB5
MKRILLAGVASLVAAMPVASHAQWAVIDVKSIVELKKQVGELQALYQTATRTLNSVAHPGSMGQVASNLGTGIARNPLPSTGAIPGLTNGTAGTGGFGNLGSMANNLQSMNQLYQPQGNDPTAQELRRRDASAADTQAMAMQMLQASQERLGSLRAIQDQLDGATDIKAVGDIQARLAGETAIASQQAAQAQQLAMLAQAQQAVDQNRADQAARQAAETWASHTQPLQ